jgi:hypothetical protein
VSSQIALFVQYHLLSEHQEFALTRNGIARLASMNRSSRARVEERTLPVDMRLAKDMLIVHLRLIQSVLGQKAEAKPMGSPHRGCSQDGAAMRRHEVARLPGGMELPLGWSQERATSAVAKFGRSASNATGQAAAYSVSSVPMAPVVRATTSCTWNVRFTDEVPRRPAPLGPVSPGYKSHTKGLGYASGTGTASLRPRPKGCQQRQSRGARVRSTGSACSERQNLRVPPGPLRVMGPVSPATAATKWRGGTSSRQLAGSLSNSPQQPEPGQAAVRSR